MNASRLCKFLYVLTDRMDCSFISGLVTAVVPLRAPMKSADSRLLSPTSWKLWNPFRLGESRSDLSCHHKRCLRNLSAILLPVKR
jgi:hypothetical protein